jgi:hypothetical protein
MLSGILANGPMGKCTSWKAEALVASLVAGENNDMDRMLASARLKGGKLHGHGNAWSRTLSDGLGKVGKEPKGEEYVAWS